MKGILRLSFGWLSCHLIRGLGFSESTCPMVMSFENYFVVLTMLYFVMVSDSYVAIVVEIKNDAYGGSQESLSSKKRKLKKKFSSPLPKFHDHFFSAQRIQITLTSSHAHAHARLHTHTHTHTYTYTNSAHTRIETYTLFGLKV